MSGEFKAWRYVTQQGFLGSQLQLFASPLPQLSITHVNEPHSPVSWQDTQACGQKNLLPAPLHGDASTRPPESVGGCINVRSVVHRLLREDRLAQSGTHCLVIA